MDKRKHYVDLIIERLSYLKTRVTVSNALNLNDINIHAENFFRELLNLVLEKNFENTNFFEQNAAYVDLVDKRDKIGVQVTSQNDNTKITDTIKGFFSKDEYKDFELKILLISKDAKSYRTDFTEQGTYNFDVRQDIWDVTKLIAFIQDKHTNEIEKIALFIEKEVAVPRIKSESYEVETIMALIDFLSKDKNRVLSDKQDNIDPEFKINHRFSNHASFIIEQYQSLYTIYFSALTKARERIDTVNAFIISSYLKDESDIYLNQANNNPKEALNQLVEFFHTKLSENGFIAFNKQAIRFYLLDEMIKCNVFPNV